LEAERLRDAATLVLVTGLAVAEDPNPQVGR
jgi:hypothetical protein